MCPKQFVKKEYFIHRTFMACKNIVPEGANRTSYLFRMRNDSLLQYIYIYRNTVEPIGLQY